MALSQWTFGASTLQRVIELEEPLMSPFEIYGDCTQAHLDANRSWLQPRFQDAASGNLTFSIQSFLVRQSGLTILVDSCGGNDKERTRPHFHRQKRPWLDTLRKAGAAPEDIDIVLCTHLHVDHVGWNTRWVGARWVPTFANARYLFARKEWEHWAAEAGAREAAGQGGGAPDDVLGDSVRPILDAGLAELVDTDHRLTDEVGLEPTPGHTPGHVSVRIESAGQRAVITGDLMHHPIQCAEPDRLGNFDHDAEQARATRRYFLACCARDRTLVFGTHFAPPTAGHVVAADGAWRFDAQ